jgi:hypothetical protein
VSLYLAPASRENLECSIERAVPPARLARHHVPSSTLQDIQARAGMEGIRCWAMTRGSQSHFDKMQPGDIVLLSETGTKRFTHCALVTFKLVNKALGDDLWPVKGEKSWELIYFLRNIQRISIPKSEVVMKFGFKPNFDVPGITPVKDHRIQAFEAKHGPLEDWLDWFNISYSQEGFTGLLGNLQDAASSDYSADDVAVIAKRRRMHAQFAKQVKANYEEACAMCGLAEPDFLVAGHIVAWSEDKKNRLNPANGICLCVLHDRAFERGFLVLDEDLNIRMNPRIRPDSQLGLHLKDIVGRRLRLPRADPPDPELLKRHREKFPHQSE